MLLEYRDYRIDALDVGSNNVEDDIPAQDDPVEKSAAKGPLESPDQAVIIEDGVDFEQIEEPLENDKY